MKKVVELKEATVQVNNGLDNVKTILDHVNLTIYEHDFLTILGGNGAGKSTLFNVIAGTLMLTSGSIFILGKDVTHLPAEKRASDLARVFQDPKMGTAPRMTVAETSLLLNTVAKNVVWSLATFTLLQKNFRPWWLRLAMVWKSIWKRRQVFYLGDNVRP